MSVKQKISIQPIVDQLYHDFPDLICGVAIEQKQMKPSWFRFFSSDEFDSDRLREYAVELVSHSLDSSSKILFQIVNFKKYSELLIKIGKVNYLFLTKLENTNISLLTDALYKFCASLNELMFKHQEQNFSSGVKLKIIRTQLDIQVEIHECDGKALVHHVFDSGVLVQGFENVVKARLKHLKNLPIPELIWGNYVISEQGLKVVRPFIYGQNLQQILTKNSRLSIKQTFIILLRILNILLPLHDLGLSHGNLSPTNIFFTPQKKILLVDDFLFNLLNYENLSKIDLKNERLPVGNLSFLSPTQLYGRSQDPSPDYWALASLMYLMISGKALYDFSENHNESHVLKTRFFEAFSEIEVEKNENLVNFIDLLIPDDFNYSFSHCRKAKEYLDTLFFAS